MYAAAHRNRRLLGIMGVYVAVATLAQAAGPGTEKLAVSEAKTGETLNPVNQPPGGRLVPLPSTVEIRPHFAQLEGMKRDAGGAGADDKLVYENVEGQYLLSPQPLGFRIADDIMTSTVAECGITSLRIRVGGGADGTGVFSTTMELWTGCPGTPGTSVIPGTQVVFAGLNDDSGILHDLYAPIPEPPYTLQPTFWILVYFDTPTAGWVVGAPATRGFSTDSYFHPFTWCDTFLGGWPEEPHASFFAEIYAEPSCGTHYLAYLAATAPAPTFIPPGGANNAVADDLALIVEDCELSAYQLGTRGTTGSFEMSMDLRQHPTMNPYPGTERVFYGKGQGSLEVAYFTIPEEEVIELPREVYISWKANRGGVGVLNIGRNQAGSSDCTYWMKDLPGFPGWTIQPNPITGPSCRWRGGPYAIFYAAIFCRGETPRGACCPNQEPGAPSVVCNDDTTVLSCLGERWQRDALCGEGEDDPFDPPCGSHVCCSAIDPDDPGNTSRAVCKDRSFDDCVAITDPTEDDRPCESDRDCPASRKCQTNGICEPKRSRWFPGEFCGEYGFKCPYFTCFDGEGNCLDYEDELVCDSNAECPKGRRCLLPQEHICEARLGCRNLACCDAVCAGNQANRYCCMVAWDWVCAKEAGYYKECAFPPDNDDCHDDHPELGAEVIELDADGDMCVTASNERATLSADDPGFCCHYSGIDTRAFGTIWYKFKAVSSSARIQTCDTAYALEHDSLIQVFSIADSNRGLCHSGDPCSLEDPDCADGSPCVFDEEYACHNLTIIGCNDDSTGCRAPGDRDRNADVCVDGLIPGDWYYVLLGTSTPSYQGYHRLCIETPCPVMPVPEDECDNASLITDGVTPFDLTGSTLDCPAEECLPAMKNDVWHQYQASCTGNLTVHTCGPTDSPHDDPDTTMSVYEGLECPPSESSLVACNDDAEIDKRCTLSGNSCSTADDCLTQKCTVSGIACNLDGDCPPEEVCDYFPEIACTLSAVACTESADCDIGSCRGDAELCSVSAHENPLICSRSQRCNLIEECIQSVCSLSGRPCASLVHCDVGECDDDASLCSYQAHQEPGICKAGQGPCWLAESCRFATCDSTCGKGSHVGMPVFNGQYYKLRLGGSFGGEPVGEISIECVADDCNQNAIPDLLDIQDGRSEDCNQNSEPDECEIDLHSQAPGGPYYCTSDCDPDCNNNGRPDICDIDIDDGGWCVVNCDSDSDRNGIPDSCELCRRIVSGNPPNCSIDARQPCWPDGSHQAGWDRIELTFNQECLTAALGPDDFLIEVMPAGPEPQIDEMLPDGNIITLRLDSSIAPGHWTCFTYKPSAERVCLGYLPGDVTGDGTANPATDLSALIDCLNQPGSCAEWQSNINRDSTATVADLTRLIDLFAGAASYSNWSGQAIGTCPSRP